MALASARSSFKDLLTENSARLSAIVATLFYSSLNLCARSSDREAELVSIDIRLAAFLLPLRN